ncbi:alanine--glyoxylate aminotransferase family protein [Magnetospira sp. QH-2]|uniref:pyridoxal-phosphate-dependent aminotransferase family protein n=1 Tax=Magnetospira sp. (strain QH-2) TaxID=1288970 RepID=UPI0003E81852|nr:alanine--glyoxylate aminotransferase family protein [Magnetospira sp. QH-2]CCQ74363.1 Serine--pyruvate aminotransferase(Alanine--glyoxylate aminotransferase) [Magnetospira sp. QH-2]
MNSETFNPPQRILMGPGPSDVHPRVLSALARPTVGHLDPAFSAMMEEVKGMLRQLFRTDNALTFPISGPGMTGMESCFVNLVEPGDKVIVCRNGVFGDRMQDIAKRCGGEVTVLDDAWGTPVDPQKLEDALKAQPGTKVVAFVHAETSTGVQSDAAALCKLASDHGALSIVDTVTSLGGIPVEVDGWGADAVYSGTQKCLSCPPGLSPVTFSPRAAEAVKARTTPAVSWFLDLGLVMGYWEGGGGKRAYHHTAPVNALYGLHESLKMILDEGLENSWARHAAMHATLKQGLEELGLSFLVDEAHRLPQLNAVNVPDGVDEAAVRSHALNAYGLEIGAGLGALAGKVWRIGLMGQSANERNIALCLRALKDGL